MVTRPELRPGRTYMLDDFTVLQVVEVADGWVRYRTRAWLRGRRVVLRRIRTARLARRVRAEINGDYFPGLALPGLHAFARPKAETSALAAYLAERAALRPFAGEG